MSSIEEKRSSHRTSMRLRRTIALAAVLCAGCGDGPTSAVATTASSSAPPIEAARDVTAPVPTIVSPQMGDTIARNFPSLTIRVAEDHGLKGLRVLIDDLQGGEPQEWVRLGGDLSQLLGRDIELGAMWFPPLLLDGTYGVIVEAVDLAGNVGRSEPMYYTFITPEISARIVVDSFSVIEFQYPGSEGWYYAPQARVTNPDGQADLQLVGFEMLSIPGLASPFPSTNACALVVRGAESLELFGEVYGDWELSYFARDGHRSTGGMATARLTYSDAAGMFYTTELLGPIVAGALPTTYSGGRGHWGCRSALFSSPFADGVSLLPGARAPSLQDDRRGRFPFMLPGNSRLKVHPHY